MDPNLPNNLGNNIVSNTTPKQLVQNNTPTMPPVEAPPRFKTNFLLFIVLAVAILVVLGSFGYLYMSKKGPFTIKAVYTEANFMSGIMEKFGEMKSSTYSASASLSVGPRDKDAVPFVVRVSNTNELREVYQNDSMRSRDITTIINTLKYAKKLPVGIDGVFTNKSNMINYYGDYSRPSQSIKDPKTGQNYKYKLINNGDDYELTVDFETNDAIKSIKRTIDLYSSKEMVSFYGFSATSTSINGKTVIFRKNSPASFYVPSEPPKPLFVQFSDGLRMLPKDINVSVAFGATVDNKEENANWLFNFDAKGDFGDLTYRVNADASKVGEDYYFKINNIPSLLGDLSSLKGQWVKVSSSYIKSTTSGGLYGGTVSYLAKEFPSYEKDYQKNRERTQRLLNLAVKIGEETKLISFKNEPTKEKILDENFTKYEVEFNKGSILEFYRKLSDAVMNDKDLYSNYPNTFDDQGMLEYLQSQEFSDVFDYFNKNTFLTFWVDDSGFVKKVEERLRVIPPDTAEQLKDSQINVVFGLTLSKINEPVNILVPKDFKLIEEVTKSIEKNFTASSPGAALTSMKSNLSGSRAQAEIIYDKNNGYGTKSFKLGPCKKTSGTLFADDLMFKAITNATNNKPESATCSSNIQAWAISVPYPDDPKYSWCVDGLGSSKQITGSIKGNSCN